MRRFAVLLVVVALFTAACGDDDTGGEPGSAVTTPVPAPQATDSPPPEATSAPQVTAAQATLPPATTAAPVATDAPEASAKDRRIAAVALLAGEWTGEWNNTTFGSSGPITASVIVDTGAAFLLADIDIGGSVFGLEDPAPATLELDLVFDPPYELASGLLGGFTVDIGADGSFTLVADNVRAEGISTMTITGTIDPAGFTATYAIEFDGGGGAEGTIEAAKTG